MTKIFAHRGYRSAYPENTMLAFHRAADCGVDGIELDVQLTKDKAVVICHDDSIDRTSNGSGLVKERTLHDLRALDFGQGEVIPTLAEFLEWFAGTDLLVNIEMKDQGFDYVLEMELSKKVAESVARYDVEDRVIVSSFDHSLVQSYKGNQPAEVCAFLDGQNLVNPGSYCAQRGIDCYHPDYRFVTEALVGECHNQGVLVNTWTVDESADFQRMLDCGVDGIITNDASLAKHIQ